jgi:D-3-phosphoglycerate dehydrogenase
MKHKFLIIDDLHPAFMEGLAGLDISFSYLPDIQRKEMLEIIPEYTGLVFRSKTFADRELLDAGVSLKLIARAGSGMDNLDHPYAVAKGIKCINAPEGNRDAVAEHAVGLILALTRNIVSSFSEVREYRWDRERNRGEEMTEMTLAIIGFGNTGEALARKMSGFGGKTLFYDKKPRGVATPWAQEALMKEIYEQADIVSFHIPLDDQNAGIISRELISGFKKPFYLLNLSRGGIMNTEDVLWGLKEGKIRGLALDVLEDEKIARLKPEQRDQLDQLLSLQAGLMRLTEKYRRYFWLKSGQC